MFVLNVVLMLSVADFVGAQSSKHNNNDYKEINVLKCCPLNKILSYERHCISEPEGKEVPDVAWLLSNLTVLSTSLQEVEANIRFSDQHTGRPCQSTDTDLILYDDGMALLQDGSLYLSGESRNHTFPPDSFCMDRFVETFVILLCPCTSAVCVQKCCHPYLILETSDKVRCGMPPDDLPMIWSQDLWTHEADMSRPLYEMHSFPNCEAEGARYIVDKHQSLAISDFQLTTEGGLRLANNYFPPRRFCGDIALTKEGISTLKVMACRFRLSPSTKHLIYGILYIIGTVSLILTVLVHLLIPELRKTAQAYIMIAYCSSLAFAYVSQSFIIFAGVKIQGTIFCSLLGLIIQAGFLAAFFWLNVMCIDIASTFRGMQLMKSNGKINKGKKFFVFCFYVYGITALIIGLTVIAEFLSPGNPTPIFARESCWFNDVITAAIFFFLPLGLSQLINILLFIFTTFKIYKAQTQTAILSRDGSSRHTGKKPYTSQDKRRLFLYVKLFFLMGLTWLFEVISATVDEDNRLWYITDVINMLSGVIIFGMFCCKRKVFKLFLSRIKCSEEIKNNSHKASLSPKISNSYSTRSSSFNLFHINSPPHRNEVFNTSSPNYQMSYL